MSRFRVSSASFALGFTVAMLLLGAPFARAEAELAFKSHGKAVKTLPRADVEKLLPPAEVTTFEFLEAKENRYRAIPFAALLTKIYGEAWKKEEEILFTCADGYQPSVPVAKVLKFGGLLAVARTDQDKFSLVNHLENNKQVDLGPYYLVWDNLKFPELKDEGATDQPYQVVGVDLIKFSDRFPALAPHGDASVAAKRGFLVFRRSCLSCHVINGEGGAKAALELNYPVSITEYWQEKYLGAWIENPKSVRYGTTMPPIQIAAKDRKEAVADVIAYLKAMAKNKVAPKAVAP